MRVLVLTALVVVAAATQNYYKLPNPYSYSCKNSLCIRGDRSQASEYHSLENCQLTCGKYGTLWPQPTGETELSKQVVHFNPYNMQVTKIAASNQNVADMLDEATRYFRRTVHFNHPNFPESQKTPYTEDEQATFEDVNQQERFSQFNQYNEYNQRQQQNQQRSGSRFNQQNQGEFEPQIYEEWERYSPFRTQRYNAGVENHRVNLEITVTSPEEKFSIRETDESYNIVVQTLEDETTITILASTYYGARHALESLSQLIAYDDNNEALMIVRDAKIQDKPQYKYRGVMLDTGRNFYTKEELMTLLDSMSQNKMNAFHWHITDAASFPMYSNRIPQMAYYGSYSPRKVYYPQDIREIVTYARKRGISVIPELTAPAHTAAGWQWGEKEGKGKLVLCTHEQAEADQPWFQLGKEPPSGQINAVNPEVYPVLGEIYRDMMDYFDPEFFHMGGDDVSFKCWQNAPEIKEYLAANGREPSSREYFELWNTFQSNAYSKLQEASPGRQVTPVIHSSSFARNYIDKDTYVIQLTDEVNSTAIADYVSNGFQVIFSNYDQWRLDCHGNWVGEKAASCPVEVPTWRNFYDSNNGPLEMLFNLGLTNARSDLPFNRPNANQQQPQQQGTAVNPKDFVLGGTATLWSAETDGKSFQPRMWPRVSAMAERLWSDPITHVDSPQNNAQKRLNVQRMRMVNRGIKAEPLTPEFCMHNEGACYSQEEYKARSEIVQQ